MLSFWFLIHTGAGSALARMVLKFQMKNVAEDRSRPSSDLIFSEDGVDKNYDWNFISDQLVDSVFPLSDDIDSEGNWCSVLFSFCNLNLLYQGYTVAINQLFICI